VEDAGDADLAVVAAIAAGQSSSYWGDGGPPTASTRELAVRRRGVAYYERATSRWEAGGWERAAKWERFRDPNMYISGDPGLFAEDSVRVAVHGALLRAIALCEMCCLAGRAAEFAARQQAVANCGRASICAKTKR